MIDICTIGDGRTDSQGRFALQPCFVRMGAARSETQPSARGIRRRLALAVAALAALSIWAFTEDTNPTRTTAGVRVRPTDAYNPVSAGEPLPDGFRQLLPRDAIMPVYDPVLAPADSVDWPADTDVIGVAMGGEAKAYPVGFLSGRELVVDEIDGVPILVSW